MLYSNLTFTHYYSGGATVIFVAMNTLRNNMNF